MSVKLHLWGEFACFTRPEMKAERVSYDAITPSAARGALEAIYWKPQIRWVIERIHVLKPIRFTSIRRNEVGRKMSVPSKKVMDGQETANVGLQIEDERQQRASLVLRDVAYVIEARFDILDMAFERDGPAISERECAGKHLDMFNRRARKGQYFHHPYLGTREFAAHFALIEKGDELPASELPPADRDRDFGYMLHDIVFDQNPKTKEVKSTTPHYFRAQMKNGVIEVPPFSQALA